MNVTAAPSTDAEIELPPETVYDKTSSKSTSVPVNVIEVDSSSLKTTDATASRTGESLTGVTVNMKIWLLLASPSETFTLTNISPLKLSAGVTLSVLPSTEALPLPSTDAK